MSTQSSIEAMAVSASAVSARPSLSSAEVLGAEVLSSSAREALAESGMQPSGVLHRNPTGDLEAYDLTGRSHAVRGGMPGLSIICERFASAFRRTLSSAIRQTCDIQPVNTEVIKFSDFILQVPRPTGLFVFQLPPLPGGCAVVIDGHLLTHLVDAMCGGQTGDLEAPAQPVERDLTHIELRLLRRLAPSMAEDLTYAWTPLATVDPEFSRIVVRPELSHLADDPEAILFSVFEIQIGRFSSPLGIILPTPTIEPIKERLLRVSHVPGHVRGGKGGSRVIEHLPEVEVEMSIELGRTEIDVSTLMNLSEGDVLRLDTNADAPLRAIIEDHCKFYGQPDASGSTLVFTIDQRAE